MLELRLPKNELELKAIHDLRNKVLFIGRGRADYNRNHPDDKSSDNYFMGFWEEDELLGTLRVDFLNSEMAALRLVAISLHQQRHGIGRQMVRAAENFIFTKGRRLAVTNAAIDAEGFYAKLGYKKQTWHDPSRSVDKRAVPMQKALVLR